MVQLYSMAMEIRSILFFLLSMLLIVVCIVIAVAVSYLQSENDQLDAAATVRAPDFLSLDTRTRLMPNETMRIMVACSQVVDNLTSRISADACMQRSEILGKLQTFHDTLPLRSERRTRIADLQHRIGESPSPSDGVTHTDSTMDHTPSERAAHSLNRYMHIHATSPSWHVASNNFSDEAISMGVDTVKATTQVSRCEDLDIVDCSADHCTVLRSDAGGNRPAVCVSLGRQAARWIVPPKADNAWDICDRPEMTGGSFDDQHYDVGSITDDIRCHGRMQWWASKCGWDDETGSHVLYRQSL
jgi:hypothetical protein